MRARCPFVALLLLALAAPARAQVATREITVETGISAPVGRGDGAAAPLALAAALWLEGDLDLVLRLAGRSASRTGERPAVVRVSGTAGLRWSFAPSPLRPQVFVEAGWEGTPSGEGGLAVGLGAALEWSPARGLALFASGAGRWAPAGWRLEATAGAGAYF